MTPPIYPQPDCCLPDTPPDQPPRAGTFYATGGPVSGYYNRVRALFGLHSPVTWKVAGGG